MTKGRSKYEFYQESMMAQRVADKYPEFTEYAGSDSILSDSIAFLNFCAMFGIMDKEDIGFKMVKGLLNELRKSRFATSEKVNEISKMGFMLPKGTKEVDFDDDTG